ncbi:MAG TPA: CapA family protein [Candidatus Paceibacterota bacterium]|nr:CapA family protein [Candidatus Paceibacterota bacterium]
MAIKQIAAGACVVLGALAVLGVALRLEPGLGIVDHPATIVAMGDIMLDRTVRTVIDRQGFGYVFDGIREIFSGAQAVVGNLEGGFTDTPSISVVDHTILHFTFDPRLAPELRALGFDTVSLANNHAYDFGASGFASTRRYLGQAGIASFGSPSNDENLSIIRDVEGLNVAFVGYHEFYSPSVKPIVERIASLRGLADFIIVYPHWGVEYEKGFTPGQQERAHAFIDAGADAVIGAHPHVIEPIEIYRGKPIFYSLGNFIFDQDFSLATRQGLTLRLVVGARDVEYRLVPVTMLHSKLSMPPMPEREAVLEMLANNSLLSGSLKDSIRQGKFSLPR